MTPPGPAVPLWNLANVLTMSRMALVPVFLFALLEADGTDPLWRATAAVVFGIATVTDHVDGDLARRWGQVTDFGKIADPIADKTLIGAALIGLSALGELSWWVTIVIAVREVGVTVLRFWVLRHGVIPASRGGKVKAFAQAVAIGLYLLPLPVGVVSVRWAAMGVAVVLTVVTGADYVVRALTLRATARRALPAQ